MNDLVQAPFVVAARLPRLWWEALGGNPFGPRETDRMFTEKVLAFQEGFFGAHMEWLKGAFAVSGAMSRLEPVAAPLAFAASAIVSASLSPSSRRVRSNVRRLYED